MKLKAIAFLILILSRYNVPNVLAEGFSLDVRWGSSDQSVFHMTDADHGWARGTNAIFTTDNGGKSWREVLDTQAEEPMTACFFDANTVWIVSGAVDSGTNASVWRTRDGGRTWESANVPLINPVMSASISFPDENHGWLMLIPDHGMNSSPGELFRTRDGGKHWTRINRSNEPKAADSYTDAEFERTAPYLTCGGKVLFRNAADGWVLGSLTTTTRPFLFVTHDGGMHWQGQKLTPPESLKGKEIEPLALPSFYPPGGKKGTLWAASPHDDDARQSAMILYRTRNGGRTWQPATSLIEAGCFSGDFVDAARGWICGNEVGGGEMRPGAALYRTADGGVSWNSLDSDAGLGRFIKNDDRVSQLEFTDDKSGWAVVINNTLSARMYLTKDGGETWRRLGPAM